MRPKTGPAGALLTSKKYAFAVLYVTAAMTAFSTSTSIVERCCLACSSAFVVAMYMISNSIVEREIVINSEATGIDEEDATIIIDAKKS
jgi:hypothetical protein